MTEVIVGVALTAVLGGLLVPAVKGLLDRRGERYRASVALVDALADSLWAYFKLALQVAHYGSRGERASADLDRALIRWDGDAAWDLGSAIQMQVSRARRLLPPAAHRRLDQTQRSVVEFLDGEIDRCREAATPDGWRDLHVRLVSLGGQVHAAAVLAAGPGGG